jgi:hypothetical protein
MELADHDFAGARASLASMLEVVCEPRLRSKIVQTLEGLRSASAVAGSCWNWFATVSELASKATSPQGDFSNEAFLVQRPRHWHVVPLARHSSRLAEPGGLHRFDRYERHRSSELGMGSEGRRSATTDPTSAE